MQSTLLRRALQGNALFSLACGSASLFFAASLAPIIGGVDPWILRLLGVGLFLFAAVLFWLARSASVNPGAALAVTFADLGWVAGSILLLSFASMISADGRVIIASVAGIVLLCAILQAAGLRSLTVNRDGRTDASSAFEIRRAVSVSPDAMWGGVSDLGAIGKFYPVLRHVEVDKADGASQDRVRRTCENHQGQRWTEEVIAWDERGRSMTLAFDTTDPDFPFPVKEMYGGWVVHSSGGLTEVVVWFELTVKGGVFGEILAPMIASKSMPGIHETIVNMEEEARSSASVVPAQRVSR